MYTYISDLTQTFHPKARLLKKKFQCAGRLDHYQSIFIQYPLLIMRLIASCVNDAISMPNLRQEKSINFLSL